MGNYFQSVKSVSLDSKIRVPKSCCGIELSLEICIYIYLHPRNAFSNLPEWPTQQDIILLEIWRNLYFHPQKTYISIPSYPHISTCISVLKLSTRYCMDSTCSLDMMQFLQNLGLHAKSFDLKTVFPSSVIEPIVALLFTCIQKQLRSNDLSIVAAQQDSIAQIISSY